MRKLLLIAVLALGTAAWAQSGMQNQQLKGSDFDRGQSTAQQGNDWYQAHLNRYIDQFTSVNNHVTPEIAGIVDQQDQFNGAPAAMAGNAGSLEGQQAMASNAGGEDNWYNRKVQADATLNQRALQAIRNNPDLNSADVE
jgi:hypothetical protein